jgi:hypothetical protein
MQRFTPLTHLSSIEIALMHDAYDPWTEDLLVEVMDQHPNLCKVFLKGTKHNLWKLSGNTWKKMPVRVHSSWELVKGAIDDL